MYLCIYITKPECSTRIKREMANERSQANHPVYVCLIYYVSITHNNILLRRSRQTRIRSRIYAVMISIDVSSCIYIIYVIYMYTYIHTRV